MMARALLLMTLSVLLPYPFPVSAQAAPPLIGLTITGVSSATQAERIGPDQAVTARRHDGPVTIVVRETGIGRARVLRVDGVVTQAPASQRLLCGAAVVAGACRPGEPATGIELTYHLAPLPSGTRITVQDSAMTAPARTFTAEITLL